MALVETTWQGRTAVLTLNRPSKRNALHRDLFHALRDAVLLVGAESPRAVVLTGSGDHFSAGLDLSPANPLLGVLLQALQAGDRDAFAGLIAELNGCLDPLASLPCPTIAAIEGHCVGAGLEVALACDLRVLSSTARLALPETRVGLVPDVGGTRRLTALVGRSRAIDLIATCRAIDADEALTWGLANRTTPAGGALAGALELASSTRVSAPGALEAALELARGLKGLADEDARALETRCGVKALVGGEAVEGATAFAERRPPRWTQD